VVIVTIVAVVVAAVISDATCSGTRTRIRTAARRSNASSSSGSSSNASSSGMVGGMTFTSRSLRVRGWPSVFSTVTILLGRNVSAMLRGAALFGLTRWRSRTRLAALSHHARDFSILLGPELFRLGSCSSSARSARAAMSRPRVAATVVRSHVLQNKGRLADIVVTLGTLVTLTILTRIRSCSFTMLEAPTRAARTGQFLASPRDLGATLIASVGS